MLVKKALLPRIWSLFILITSFFYFCVSPSCGVGTENKINSVHVWLQVIWVCILCRKKQELVVKTGKWILPSIPGPMQHQSQQQQQQSGFGSVVGGGLLINDKRPRLERAVSYDRESSSVGVSAGFGHHHHRTSSTSSVDPSGIIRSGSSLAGGQPAGYQNIQQQQQQNQQHQVQNRGQLQRSGSLQSHGTSSWRNNVPHQMSSDLIDNSPARGTYHRMKKTICVFPRYPTLLYQIFISFSFFFFAFLNRHLLL